MERALRYLIVTWLLFVAPAAFAQNTVIYQDDFEGTVSGWSVNNTEFDPDTTRFLGRFDDSPQETSRTFTVPAGTDQLVIEFDLYRFDSWDNNAQFGFDRFQIDIDGGQIFSLPFPNPQDPRSAISGNVDWSHTPLTGSVELAFNTGEFWFDQIHRFVITVNNPGPTVSLTLRTNLNQGGNDESGGYDNFLVTAMPPPATEITANPESFSIIDSAAGGTTASVLGSDTYNNQPATLSDVTLTQINSTSLNVALDPATGLISVAPGTPAGTYLLEYNICEITEPANCSTTTEMITVAAANPGGSFCPAGTVAVPGTYHAVSATSSQQSPQLAIGQPLPEGTTETGSRSATTFFGPITMDLTGDPMTLIPEGELVEVVLSSAWNPQGLAEILTSIDGVTYTSLGTTGNGGTVYGPWTANILRYDDFIMPSGGARFLQVSHLNGGVRADGVIYNTQCHEGATPPVILAVDDTQTLPFSAVAQTNVINVVSNDRFDDAAAASFDLSLNAGSTLPAELTFDVATGDIGVAAGAAAGTYSFDYDICEAGTTNCETANVTILIEPASPSLVMIKTANAPGPYSAGEVVTYTYRVTNDGDTIIRNIVINDTHNGSDPAPTPINETLLTDNGTSGDSTDAANDGSWDVLAPDDVITFTGTYTVTQLDVDNL